MSIPALCIVGYSDSGKTTLTTKLITELVHRGYRVATIKHAEEVDMPAGKDGDRHLVAGSCSTAVVAPDKVVLTIPATSPTPVEEVMRLMGNDYDILLCEGYKYSSLPKIESHINPAQPLLRGIEGIAAVATTEKLDTPLKQFNFEDTNAITDFIEERFLNKHADDISVYVNGTNIPLIQFPKSIIPNVLLAMVGSLKGVDDIRHLQINLKRSEIQS